MAADNVTEFPLRKKAPRKKSRPAGESVKNRIKAVRRVTNSEPVRQNFIPNVPGYLEEMLLAIERAAEDYLLPDVQPVARAMIEYRYRLTPQRFDEFVTWVTNLRAELQRQREADK